MKEFQFKTKSIYPKKEGTFQVIWSVPLPFYILKRYSMEL